MKEFHYSAKGPAAHAVQTLGKKANFAVLCYQIRV